MGVSNSDHKICKLLILSGATTRGGSGHYKNRPNSDAYCRGIKYCTTCVYHIKTKVLNCKCCGNLFRTRHRQKKGNPYHICSIRKH